MADFTTSQRKALAAMEASRLPDGAVCGSCSNYQSWCRQVLAGEKPFDGDSRHCFWGRHEEFFNVNFRNVRKAND